MTQVIPSEEDTGIIDINPKVLIVDDEPEIVEEVQELLEGEGFLCVGVTSSQEAMDCIENDRTIAIVLSDIRMPSIDGLEMARRIIDTHGPNRDISLILMTGHAGMSETIEALQLGAEDFLLKPVNPDQLIHSVQRAREIARLRQREREFKVRLALEVKAKTRESRALAEELVRRNTDLQQKNAQLAELAQLKGRFMSMISHELNTPINGIIGFSQILQTFFQESGDQDKSQITELIIQSSERLRNNVDAILTLASVQSGDLTAVLQPIIACDLLDGVVTARQHEAKQRNITIQFTRPEHQLSLLADPRLSHQAVDCIFDNAIKFAPDGGTVTLASSYDTNSATITIHNTGPGMSEDAIKAAFEPLYQVDCEATINSDGLGLGLPLAEALFKLQNGHIKINSTPGQGTTVSLTLPLTDKTPERT